MDTKKIAPEFDEVENAIPEDNSDLLGPPTATEKSRVDLAVENIKERSASSGERVWSFAELCDEWIYVTEWNRFIWFDSDGKMTSLKPEVFDKRFAYCKPDTKAHQKLKTVSQVMFHRFNNTIRKPMRTLFLPGESPGMLGSDFNLYVRSSVVAAPGDTGLWDEHLEYLYPDKHDRDLVLNWFAWLLQNLDLKPKHALLLAGRMHGTGKSFVRDVVTRIIGVENVAPVSGHELSSSFNKWALASKLITIEELDALEKNIVKHTLHPIITQESLTINDKGIPTFKTDNCFGILAMTNKDAALKLDNFDRRYLVVRTPATPRATAYYRDLYTILDDPEALGAIAHELLTRNVGEYSGQERAPETAAKRDMIEAAQSDLEAWVSDQRESFPFTLDVVTEQMVIDCMPSYLQARSGTRRELRRIFRDEFEGLPLTNAKGVREQLYIDANNRPSVWVLHGKHDEVLKLSNERRVALLVKGQAEAAKAITFQPDPNADLFE